MDDPALVGIHRLKRDGSAGADGLIRRLSGVGLKARLPLAAVVVHVEHDADVGALAAVGDEACEVLHGVEVIPSSAHDGAKAVAEQLQHDRAVLLGIGDLGVGVAELTEDLFQICGGGGALLLQHLRADLLWFFPLRHRFRIKFRRLRPGLRSRSGLSGRIICGLGLPLGGLRAIRFFRSPLLLLLRPILSLLRLLFRGSRRRSLRGRLGRLLLGAEFLLLLRRGRRSRPLLRGLLRPLGSLLGLLFRLPLRFPRLLFGGEFEKIIVRQDHLDLCRNFFQAEE